MLRKPQFFIDEKEIAKTVMMYLRYSSDRCGGRAQKARSSLSSQDDM